MSRYAFGEILGNEAAVAANHMDSGDDTPVPRDTKGYGLDQWIDYAVVGWDEPMQTYFLQYLEDEEELVWWPGTDHAEIPTFADLCRVIRRIFGEQ